MATKFIDAVSAVISENWDTELADGLWRVLGHPDIFETSQEALRLLEGLCSGDMAVLRTDHTYAVEDGTLENKAMREGWSESLAMWVEVLRNPPKRSSLSRDELTLVSMWEGQYGHGLAILQAVDWRYNNEWIADRPRFAIWFLRHNGQPPAWYKN